MLLLIWLTVFIGAVWLWLRKKLSYFKEHGINYLKPLPFVGNLGKLIFRMEHMTEVFDRVYHAFPNDRFVGSYTMTNPLVFLRDPELIKLVGVKEFEHFTDHNSLNNENDFMFSKTLITLKGQKWRDMRSTLSPAFTGSKLRNMVPLIHECNKDLTDSLDQQIKDTPDKYLDLDTQDLLRRYATDVIATCAFGLKTNSIQEKDNEFYRMGIKLTNFTAIQLLKVSILTAMPFISKVINFNIMPKDAVSYLRHIVLSTMQNREEQKIYRPDMIQLLMEVRKGTLTHENIKDEKDAGFATVEESSIGKGALKQVWDDDYLIAQAFLFFFAGLDTVSTALKFLLYELAVNPDIQETLRREIDDHHDKHQGKIVYDEINQMKYLDMVVSEGLRKWPPAVNTDRNCVKNFNLGKPNDSANKDYIVTEKINVGIPIWSLHRDPQYYENPEKFDPERFSDENKHNIKPFTYLPFGLGPRNCIGSRFALVEVKVLAYSLLRRFEISPAPQTVIPPRLDKSSITFKLEGGHWLRFRCRV